MSLAWSSLNQARPDAGVAETYAREALRLVPNWRYVRGVLLPQIERSSRPPGGQNRYSALSENVLPV